MRELVLKNSRVDGRFDILDLLGRGSYAEIYIARDVEAATEDAHSLVVIKALNVYLQNELDADLERTLVQNFQKEAVALDRVRHPQIISRFGHGTARDLQSTIFHYLVLEYMAGGDMTKLLKTRRLAFSEAVDYLEQLCAALAFAHSKDVIHRDIKPQNILLSEDQKVCKIADFGVARTDSSNAPITRVGTNIYAPPEHSPLIAAENFHHDEDYKLTPAADIYSLAKTFYVMLSSESVRKFAGASITSLPENISSKPYAAKLLQVLNKATTDKPSLRHQNIADFWNDVFQIRNEFSDEAETIETNEVGFAEAMRGFVPETPEIPVFKTAEKIIYAADEDERPRLVVEIPHVSEAQKLPVESERKIPAANAAAALEEPQIAPTFQGINDAPRSNTLLKVIAGIVFCVLFIGVLRGAHAYLRGENFFDFASAKCDVNVPVGCTATVTSENLNLRPAPTTRNDPIGIVPQNSKVKIIRLDDSGWAEVEVTNYNTPKTNKDFADRGWVNRKFLEIRER